MPCTTNPSKSSEEVPESQQIYYQCSVCKAFVNSTTKLKEHKEKKHSGGKIPQQSQQRSSLSDEETTTADLVKTSGKRDYLKVSKSCAYCKEPISSRYNCYLISEQKKDIFSENYACDKCFTTLI